MPPSETSFATRYSRHRTGDTARAGNTRWLFSSSTMAPIKNRPIVAGSETIITAPAIGRHAAGSTYSTKI